MANLESTSFLHIFSQKKFWYRNGKLGNNTYAFAYEENGVKRFKITLHGNTIARGGYAGDDKKILRITDAGWGTVTTRDRLNQILTDNGVPFRASQHKGVQVLSNIANRTEENHYDNGDKTNYWNPRSDGFYGIENEATFLFDYETQEWGIFDVS